MARCFFILLLACGLPAQEPGRETWREKLADARQAYARLNYREAAEKAGAAADTVAGDPAGLLEALRILVSAQRAEGQYGEAAQTLARAVDVSITLRGPDSQETAALLGEIANVERARGRSEEALEAIRRAIGMREKAAGMRAEDLARDLTTAAMLEIKLGRPEDGRAGLKRAVELWNETAPGDVQILPALEALANLYRDGSEYDQAEPLLRHALKIREGATGPDGPEVIALVDSLAYVNFGLKNFAEAEACYVRLLDLWEKAAGKEHPMRALTLDKMAEFYSFQQRYDEGRKAAAEALEMRMRMHLASLHQAGRFLLMETKLEEAEDLYRRAVQIGDLAHAPDDAMDKLLRVYAGVLRELKRTDEAQAVDSRVKGALLRKADGEGRVPPPVSPPEKK